MVEFWDILDESGNTTGRVIERGKPMAEGEYHLCVYGWIMNSNGEFLIAKRTPNKPFPGMWECVGGNAISGDDSLTSVLKEVEEEIGISLNPQNGQLYKRCKTQQRIDDIWLFRQEIDIADVVLCPGETCDAMWASYTEINRMIDEGIFITWGIFTRMEELFEFLSI